MSLDPAQHPIFVVGTGRSGTTLLRNMLCAHPHIHLTHEASFWVWDAVFARKRDGEAFLRFYLQTFSYRWLRLDPATWLGDVPRPLPRADLASMFTAVMRAKASAHGKPRWGDKTPSHSGNLARIFRDFPGARVVRIVRDPRTTVQSFTRMPWATGSPAGAAALVELERKQVAAFRERLLEIRLEDLLADPRAVMGRVLEHVGEPWDDRVLDHPRFGPGSDDVPPVPWFQSSTEAPAAYRPPDWSRWDPVELRMVEWLCRKSLAQHGYGRAQLPVVREPSRWAVFRRWLGEWPEVARAAGVSARLLLASRDPRGSEAPAYKALFRRLNPAAWERLPGFEMPDPPELPAGWDERLALTDRTRV